MHVSIPPGQSGRVYLFPFETQLLHYFRVPDIVNFTLFGTEHFFIPIRITFFNLQFHF